jgi:serine/threonine protein kinase/tetratricopeptide (TPR) repeat protein
LEQSFGRYRLLERLGEGGMAEVFKAKSFGVEGFEKVLVIKRILPKLAEHPKFVDMFVHEAKLAVRLSHANIVQVFDLGRVDHPTGEPTSYFIAMEYVPGLDLASVLVRCRRQKREVPLGMAVFVAAEVAKALDHAHRRRDEQGKPLGIVHRDISPQNVLVSWEGEVKVTDFGIAKAIDSIVDESRDREQGAVRGKLAYMSPEQSRAASVDGRSDIFSLGTVLYEMITGQNPFTAPTSFETLRRVQASEYPPLELVRPDAPRAVSDIVKKMLAREAKDRFPDAGRLHDELLGYFYSAAERFGANDLAELMAQFRDATTGPELGASVFEEEHAQANERTPVEVPRANTSGGSRTANPLPATSPGREAPAPLRPPDLGQRREVTALVLTFGSERDREATTTDSDVTGSILQRAGIVLTRYGGAVIETEAAQITALFGLTEADGRDTEAAVRAALVIQRARIGGATVCAGVHVARIVVDHEGEPVKDERLVALVSTAQALARASDHAVCVSQLAARIIRQAFSTEDLPVSGRAIPEGGRMIASARPPSQMYGRFVGRTEELRKLGDILAAATRRRAQVVVVAGDKGIGKTRLVAEMERRLQKGNYNVGFYTATCPRTTGASAWTGLTSMLQVLCGIQEGDDEAKIREVLPRLRALGLQDDECASVLNQLGAVMEEQASRRSERGATSLVTSSSLKSAFGRMAQGLCEDRLHVFAWDDAHSLDRASLDAIVAAAGRSPGLRAVFLLTVRDTTEAPSESTEDSADASGMRKLDLVTALAELPHKHQIDLGPLSDDDTAKFVASRVNAKVVPPELLSFCRERAGGHPLFLEELLKELVDSGAVSTVSGGLRLRLEGAMAVPRSLRALIAARVARLPPELRSVTQGAAILGTPVPTEVLAALLGQKVSQVDRAISRLAARDLLRATGPALADFASPTHGEIVLDLLPPEGRRELHAASAAAYLSVFGEDSVEHAERVANHLYEAGDRDRAATFFAKAGAHKMRLGQLEPAIALVSRALDLADLERRTSTEIAGWLGILARAVFHVRRAPEIINLTKRALDRIDAAGTVEERVATRIDVSRALGSANLFEECYRRLDEAFELAGEREHLQIEGRRVEAEVASRAGDFTRAVRAVDRIEAFGPVDDERLLLVIASVRGAMNDLAAALRALDRADKLADPSDLASACARAKQRGLAYLYCGEWKPGIEASLQAVQMARSANLRYDIAVTLHNLGEAARRMSDLPRAYAALTESLEIARAAGFERLVSLNRIHLAYLDGLSGVTGAEDLLRDLVRYANSLGYWTDALEARLHLGALLRRRGAVEDAKRELCEVRDLAAAKGNHLILSDAKEQLALLGA